MKRICLSFESSEPGLEKEANQWREWFMIYLEEQTDGEAMIHSITHGLPNDIYSLIDSNDTAQELWDSLKRQMRGSEYDEQDRKAAILYEYETFKATKGEQLVDTYLRYLQVINDLKKYGYKKDNCDVNNVAGIKKKSIIVTSDPLTLVVEKTKCSFIFKLEVVPSCLINYDLEPLTLDLELLEIINLASSIDYVDSKNLLDRVSSCISFFSLLERLKANNTIRVNHLIHIESCKSPTAVLFDVDTGRISIRHYETKEYHSQCSGNITKDSAYNS
ncbi:hypothetical protein Tco_0399930 [Tanacetum coccineum]